MNIKTWITIGRCGMLLLFAAAAGMFLPKDHWFSTVSSVATVLFILLGIFGAILGVKFAFGKLHFGCPQCGTRSRVLSGNRNEFFMECPRCGTLSLTASLWGRTKVETIEQ